MGGIDIVAGVVEEEKTVVLKNLEHPGVFQLPYNTFEECIAGDDDSTLYFVIDEAKEKSDKMIDVLHIKSARRRKLPEEMKVFPRRVVMHVFKV